MSTLMQLYLGIQTRIARNPELANLEVNFIDYETDKEVGVTPKGFTPFQTADDNNFSIYVNIPQTILDNTTKNPTDKLKKLKSVEDVYKMIIDNNERVNKEIEEDRNSSGMEFIQM